MTTSTLPPLTPHGWLRWDAVRRILTEVPGGSSVLEIGPGQGAVAARLASMFRYTGIEADEHCYAVTRARLRGTGRVMNGGWEALPQHERYDVICAFEVLEHIEDDLGALEAWSSRLQPGGLLLVSTPLHAHRFGAWDELVGHYRRYGRDDLARLLGKVGLTDVVVVAYGFPLGYALEPVRNAVARRRVRSTSMQERTAASGRSLQPSRRGLGIATRVGSTPFRWMQRPFARTRLGTGVVAAGWRSQ